MNARAHPSIDSGLDPRAVLLWYYAHIAASARLNSDFYGTAPYISESVRSAMLMTAHLRAIEAAGQIATLEEYGAERWHATNGERTA